MTGPSLRPQYRAHFADRLWTGNTLWLDDGPFVVDDCEPAEGGFLVTYHPATLREVRHAQCRAEELREFISEQGLL